MTDLRQPADETCLPRQDVFVQISDDTPPPPPK